MSITSGSAIRSRLSSKISGQRRASPRWVAAILLSESPERTVTRVTGSTIVSVVPGAGSASGSAARCGLAATIRRH